LFSLKNRLRIEVLSGGNVLERVMFAEHAKDSQQTVQRYSPAVFEALYRRPRNSGFLGKLDLRIAVRHSQVSQARAEVHQDLRVLPEWKCHVSPAAIGAR
jgi:hypothetical protein